MKIRPSNLHPDIAVVEPEGRIDASSADPLRATLQSLLEHGRNRIIVDFSRVSYISSSGLVVLLVAAKRARRTDGSLRLVGLSPRVDEIFRLVGFHSIIPIHSTETQAVEAMRTVDNL